MTIRREKKSRKMHGYRNRGWGSIGQHRKSGSRGGRGAAGMHKHKWSWIVKNYRDWFGKRGFTPRSPSSTPKLNEVNVSQVEEIVNKMVKMGTAVMEGNKIVVDLSRMGINKLIGYGKITRPVKVIVCSASKKAVEKIGEIGGEVIILEK
ncbi:MAG: 50S ribosomal protein L15 [Ignisphaera sp.]|nr:50S ribosomal protein L15 [Ignisphaera sp.]MCX8168502.1 50S ribosomal protein L15 [Ignisphaera sp.]MDW8085058.1 uL15 family ribosomal protein [Ignisphaera sp.]